MTESLAIPRGWRILELGARPDYFAVWNAIRELSPVHDAGEGVFLVTRWDLVNQVLRNSELESGSGVSESFGGAGGPVEAVVRNWLMSLNGEEHRQARGLVSRLFAPKAVTGLEPAIRAAVRALVDRFIEAIKDGPADFVDLVSAPLPSEVVRALFAIDPPEWSDRVEPLFRGPAVSEADAFAAVQGLAGYFWDKIDASRGRPVGGVIDELRSVDKSGNRLTEAAVMANSVLIVTAAIDTTAGLIANTLYSLLEHPNEMARVRSNPALIPGAIDESLRYCPSAPSTTRRARVPLDLGGVTVPAGSDLFLSLAAANRDPRKFQEPDSFRIDRDATALLTFGGGAHFCLGAALARLEVRILFEELLGTGRQFALAAPVRWRTNNPSVRVPLRLAVSAA